MKIYIDLNKMKKEFEQEIQETDRSIKDWNQYKTGDHYLEPHINKHIILLENFKKSLIENSDTGEILKTINHLSESGESICIRLGIKLAGILYEQKKKELRKNRY